MSGTSKPMTQRQADVEAERRWGRKGFASDRRTEKYVGSGVGDDRYGEGQTWEQAFADAELRIAELAAASRPAPLPEGSQS
jgi:hypothetical protein